MFESAQKQLQINQNLTATECGTEFFSKAFFYNNGYIILYIHPIVIF